MSAAKRFLLDAASNYLRMMTLMVCSLVLTRAMALRLGVDDFGRWSLLVSVFGFALLLDLGFGNVVLKSAGAKDSSPSELLSAVFFAFVALSFAGFVVAIFAARSALGPSSRSMGVVVVLLAARFTVATLPWSIFRSVLLARGGLAFGNLIQSVSVILYSTAAYAALIHGWRLRALALLTLLSAVIESLALMMAVYRRYPEIRIRLKFSPQVLKPALSLGGAGLLINIAGLILLKTDPIIVNAFLPFSKVALYAVALRISENVFLLCKQLVNALTPHAIRAGSEGHNGALARLFERAVRYVTAFGVTLYCCALVMGEPAIRFWLSPDYSASAAVLNVLLLAMVLSIPQLVASNLLTFSGHHRIVAAGITVGAIVNVAASVMLVRVMGMLGVAAGTLVATVVMDVAVIVPLACRRFGFKLWDLVLGTLRAAGLPGVVQAGFLYALRRAFPPASLGGVTIECLASLAVFAVVFMFAGISESERKSTLSHLRVTRKPVQTDLAGEPV